MNLYHTFREMMYDLLSTCTFKNHVYPIRIKIISDLLSENDELSRVQM